MFKVAGPLWAQVTAGGDNVFARLIKNGKKVLRKVLQKEFEPAVARELPKPTWSLRTFTVKVDESASGRLIGGLFPKQAWKTVAAETRKQAALRLIRDARKVPVFAFVGLSLGATLDQKKGETDDVLCSGIRDLFQQYGGKESRVVGEGGQRFSLQTLHLGQLIGQGCNAAVFEARPVGPDLDEDKSEEKIGEENESMADITSSADLQSENLESQTESSYDQNMQKEDYPPAVSKSDSDDDDFSIISESDEVDDNISIICESDGEDDDISIIHVSEDEDDDISIISDDEEESDPEPSLDGWDLYRLSSISASAAPPATEEICDDSDSDIFVLAGDAENLESIPDLEELDSEFGWSVVRGLVPETGNTEGIKLKASESSGSGTASTTASLDSSLSPGHSDTTSMTTQEPEPAPNIQEDRDFPLAVKMMYNYNVESNADQIRAAMVKETVPALFCLSDTPAWEHSSLAGMRKLPPHPNIVTMHDAFVDETPDHPEGAKWYPCALPSRLNREEGLGRNATMFLVMKKYSMTLSEYLSTHTVDIHTRCLVFAQLLEGMAHLSSHGIAHRDLKSNNVLVDLCNGTDLPSLAISDFGSCLANTHYGLKLPYLTPDTDKGGNSALMAPEIKCAVSGPDSVLDYSKADIWAAGTLAYEIFGEGNPFYSGLDSRSYCEKDLPELPGSTPKVVVELVERMLKRDPSERPTPTVAATFLQLFLWAPSEMRPFSEQTPTSYNALWRFKEICHWLERLTMETVCQRVFGGGSSRLELQLKSTFLSRISRQDIFGVMAFEG